MAERVWERFLTEQDRQQAARRAPRRWGFGKAPALLLVDVYRGVFGDHPRPLVDAVDAWPASCGLAGWEALPSIQRLLGVSRRAGIPVVHTTGSVAVPPWAGRAKNSEADRERRRLSYEIVDEVAPLDGEPVLRKAAPSAFHGTPLLGYLTENRVDTLIVAGETTSGCVRASVVDARTHRYRVVVIEDCVFDRTEASHAINLFDMEQKYADVISLSEVVDHLSGLGRHRAVPVRAGEEEAVWE